MAPLQERRQSLVKATPLTRKALDHVTQQPPRDRPAQKRYTNPFPERRAPGSDLLDS